LNEEREMLAVSRNCTGRNNKLTTVRERKKIKLSFFKGIILEKD
jgi:hypothetical protein